MFQVTAGGFALCFPLQPGQEPPCGPSDPASGLDGMKLSLWSTKHRSGSGCGRTAQGPAQAGWGFMAGHDWQACLCVILLRWLVEQLLCGAHPTVSEQLSQQQVTITYDMG